VAGEAASDLAEDALGVLDEAQRDVGLDLLERAPEVRGDVLPRPVRGRPLRDEAGGHDGSRRRLPEVEAGVEQGRLLLDELAPDLARGREVALLEGGLGLGGAGCEQPFVEFRLLAGSSRLISTPRSAGGVRECLRAARRG